MVVPPPVRVTVIVGHVTVSVATLEVVVPHEFVKTARYFLPLSESAVAGVVYVVLVAPPMSLKVVPPSVESCH